MARHKVHFNVGIFLWCRSDYSNMYDWTNDKGKVTCKACLKRMKRDASTVTAVRTEDRQG
jgi:hypothetical protein